MVTYIKGSMLEEGAIVHTIWEHHIINGKPVLKKCFTQQKGFIKQRNENNQAKQDKMIEKAKAEVQSKLDVFKQVDIEEEGF